MSDWEISFLIGIALTFAYLGPVFLLYRYIMKRMRAEREEDRRRRRSFEWEDEQ